MNNTNKDNIADEVILSVLEELIEHKQHKYKDSNIYFIYNNMRLLFYKYHQYIKQQDLYNAFIETLHTHIKDKEVIDEFINNAGAMHINIDRYIPMYIALGWWRDTQDRDNNLLKLLLRELRLYISVIEHRKRAERVMVMRRNANNGY